MKIYKKSENLQTKIKNFKHNFARLFFCRIKQQRVFLQFLQKNMRKFSTVFFKFSNFIFNLHFFFDFFIQIFIFFV